MELGSIVGSTVHLIKKLTFYARHTCMGMGVSHIVRPKSKQDGGIPLVR